MKVKVIRLENYPSDIPEVKVVGFELTFRNNRTEIVETTVDLKLSDEEAVDVAFESLSSEIGALMEKHISIPPMLGFEWEVNEEIEEEIEYHNDEIWEESLEYDEVFTSPEPELED